jgi:hypothetical protein
LQCDNLYKAYDKLFNKVFLDYADESKKKGGQNKIMTLDEFQMMIKDSQIINEQFRSREGPIYFN